MLVALLTAALTAAPPAQPKPIVKTATASMTVTIQAIDQTNRLITFRDDAGAEDTVAVGPDVKRFNELKVGDRVTFKYVESLVFNVKKPGDAAPAAAALGVTKGQGPRPSGTVAEQLTTTVTVVSVDPSVPSVTVKTEAGAVVTRKIQDRKHLEGLKVGDRIEITYTRAIVAEVSDAPK
jgi:Cu/Ag efflux protein CusF